MSRPQLPGAVLFAKDLSALARFYCQVANMAVVHQEHQLMVLESSTQQLALHGIPKRIADQIVIRVPPKRREDTAVKLIFPVSSIASTRELALSLGGELDPKKNEFEARGFRACDGHDPEGRQCGAVSGVAAVGGIGKFTKVPTNCSLLYEDAKNPAS